MKAGQLLLSYPSVESYTISGFEKHTHESRLMLGKDAKAFVSADSNIQLNKFSDEVITNAANEFIDYLEKEHLFWNIDDFAETSLCVFKRQEFDYTNGKGFRVFSMLTLAFLQMGLIEL